MTSWADNQPSGNRPVVSRWTRERGRSNDLGKAECRRTVGRPQYPLNPTVSGNNEYHVEANVLFPAGDARWASVQSLTYGLIHCIKKLHHVSVTFACSLESTGLLFGGCE